jgi:branched-chain amino acid aminotransferase
MAAQFWFDGSWTGEDIKLTGPADHSFWLASMVFDGGRAFRRCAPDLDLHCRRVVKSAEALGLSPDKTGEEIQALAIEGIRRFPEDAELYIKPMFFTQGGSIASGTAKTSFVLHIFDAPLPGDEGFSATLSPLRRPAPEMAPTDAKASCLYPNSSRATREAVARGFEEAVMRDPWDNIAEFAFANLWIVKDGVALTPADNRTFLAGITRWRTMKLLNEAGVEAREATLTARDLEEADEIFSTGNYGKIVPCTSYEGRQLGTGPVARLAKQRYFEWARTTRID